MDPTVPFKRTGTTPLDPTVRIRVTRSAQPSNGRWEMGHVHGDRQ